MKPEDTQKLIDDIYNTVDRASVVQHVVGGENFRDMGSYVMFVCPECMQYKGYVRKPSGKHSGATAQCSRVTCEMHTPMSLIDFVAGQRRCRGDAFKQSLQTLAQLIGREYGGIYKPIPNEQRVKLQSKIAAKIPEGYYDPKPELEAPLKRYVEAAKDSELIKTYLKDRRIPLWLAKKFEVGLAEKGEWCHKNEKGEPVRQWSLGRIVFPVRNDKGELMNLYGRALESQYTKCGDKWKSLKHDFLPGAKGIGNQIDLSAESVHFVEGYFDLLSIKAADPKKAVAAVFGAHGFDWDLVKAKNICFAFDCDAAGDVWQQIADEGLQKGKRIFWLHPDTYEGHNDLNEVWAAKGRINFKYIEYFGADSKTSNN